MNISYTTIFMFPITIDWYRERGLTELKKRTVDTDFSSKLRNLPIGSEYQEEMLTTHYCGGRIDIRGLDGDVYDCGEHEYHLPPMREDSWYLFREWIEKLETEELWEYPKIIRVFEEETNHKIDWAAVYGNITKV